jgi:hypothetical protein
VGKDAQKLAFFGLCHFDAEALGEADSLKVTVQVV